MPRADSDERRVEWAPGTKEGPPARGPSTRRIPRTGNNYAPPAQAPQPWTPYVVGFCLLCIGPLRPLVWELVGSLWAAIMPEAVQPQPEEVPWYDA